MRPHTPLTAALRVGDVMSREPRTLGRNDRLQVADDLMRTVRCRHLPVLDERGRLAGIVSQRDLFQRLQHGRGRHGRAVAHPVVYQPRRHCRCGTLARWPTA